jgi:hypothetical protein
MATYREEFARLSEIEREAIEEWQVNGQASNRVINAKEAINAFLTRYMRDNCPPHDTEMPY